VDNSGRSSEDKNAYRNVHSEGQDCEFSDGNEGENQTRDHSRYTVAKNLPTLVHVLGLCARLSLKVD
jgi:hypothetical protein